MTIRPNSLDSLSILVSELANDYTYSYSVIRVHPLYYSVLKHKIDSMFETKECLDNIDYLFGLRVIIDSKLDEAWRLE